VLIGTPKNHNFWWVDSSICYISIGFGITWFQVVWAKLWSIY